MVIVTVLSFWLSLRK